MREIAICTEIVVIPALGAMILFKSGRLEYLLKYLIQKPLGLFGTAYPATSQEDFGC